MATARDEMTRSTSNVQMSCGDLAGQILWIDKAGPQDVCIKDIVIVTAVRFVMPGQFAYQQGDGNERH
jgi:hypothetical protein